MILLQIIEKPGIKLHKKLVEAMRSGELKTLIVQKKGQKITHTNPGYPGWINISSSKGSINCEVLSPNKPGEEWKIFSAFVGRLCHKYSDEIHSINVQFMKAPKKY